MCVFVMMQGVLNGAKTPQGVGSFVAVHSGSGRNPGLALCYGAGLGSDYCPARLKTQRNLAHVCREGACSAAHGSFPHCDTR